MTGRPLGTKDADIDHVIPTAEGGGDDIGNLQWLCKEANRAKGVLSVNQFLSLCRDVVDHETS